MPTTTAAPQGDLKQGQSLKMYVYDPVKHASRWHEVSFYPVFLLMEVSLRMFSVGGTLFGTVCTQAGETNGSLCHADGIIPKRPTGGPKSLNI